MCTGATKVAAPTTDAEGGKICPAGHYCPEGSSIETPCPFLTYNRNEGSYLQLEVTVGDGLGCYVCSGSEQCNARGLTDKTADIIICDSGYYCPDSLTKNPCDPGYFCEQNQQE